MISFKRKRAEVPVFTRLQTKHKAFNRATTFILNNNLFPDCLGGFSMNVFCTLIERGRFPVILGLTCLAQHLSQMLHNKIVWQNTWSDKLIQFTPKIIELTLNLFRANILSVRLQ